MEEHVSAGRSYGKTAEAQELLTAMKPIREPLKLTRQAARRMVAQQVDQVLRANGIPRAERRRRLWHRGESGPREFPLSDMARELIRRI